MKPDIARKLIGLSRDRVRELAHTPIAPVKLTPTSDIAKWLDGQRAKVVGRANTFIVEVTPSIAAAWLKFNTSNRQPSQAKVRRFAAAMKTHRWSLNGESIKFSVSGRLLDGQSRLMAIEKAGLPIALELRAGLPDVAQESMDSGEVRKGSHTLEMLSESNPCELAAALRMVYLHEQEVLFRCSVRANKVLENGDIKAFLDKHADLKKSVGWAVTEKQRIKQLMPVSEAAFFHYIFGKACATTRDPFFEALVEGVALTKQSPVYHLRERLLAERLSSAPIKRTMRFILIVKAWNHAVRGDRVPSLRLVAGEVIPAIETSKTKA